MVNGTKIHKYLDHPYWIPKCLNVKKLFSIDPNVKGAMSEMFDKSQMSERIDVPAGCLLLSVDGTIIYKRKERVLFTHIRP